MGYGSSGIESVPKRSGAGSGVSLGVSTGGWTRQYPDASS
jgi:hypothetical protein